MIDTFDSDEDGDNPIEHEHQVIFAFLKIREF